MARERSEAHEHQEQRTQQGARVKGRAGAGRDGAKAKDNSCRTRGAVGGGVRVGPDGVRVARADGPMRTTSRAPPTLPALRPMQNESTSYPLARAHQDASCAAMPPPPPGCRPATHHRKTTTQMPWAPPWARRQRGPSQQARHPAGDRAWSPFSSRGDEGGREGCAGGQSMDFGRTQIGFENVTTQDNLPGRGHRSQA